MKPVATNALFSETARQSERLSQIGLGTMEGCVEAGNLRNLRRGLHDRANRREVVRLMQGRERFEFREIIEHGLCHAHRRGIVEAAMDNTVTESDHRFPFEQCAPSCDDLARGGSMIEALRLEAPLLNNRACSVGDLEMRFNANPLDLPAEKAAVGAACLVDGELYAR